MITTRRALLGVIVAGVLWLLTAVGFVTDRSALLPFIAYSLWSPAFGFVLGSWKSWHDMAPDLELTRYDLVPAAYAPRLGERRVFDGGVPPPGWRAVAWSIETDEPLYEYRGAA